jgi:HPr kinase/phosphorylase
MFGPGAISPSKSIDILAELSPWEEGKSYERLGTEESYEEILGEKILKVTIPVTPGRNIPIVLETAARHYRLKQAGYEETVAYPSGPLSEEQKRFLEFLGIV